MGFDKLLRQYFAGVILLLVAASAYFQALGINRLLASALVPKARSVDEPVFVTAPDATLSTSLPADHSWSARPILDHNPFDSTTPRPLDASPPPADDTAAGPIDLEHYASAPLCEGLKALIIVATPNPRESVASLSGAPSQARKLVHLGEVIGERTVQVIEWNRVVLSSGSSLCQVQMFRTSKIATVATAPTTPLKAPGRPSPLPAPIASHIQKVSDREFNIDRGVIEKLLESQGELMRGTRMLPEQENGKVRGLRIFGIKDETLLGTLGLESGDSIRRINGFEIASPESALEAYSRLRTGEHLSVMLHRGDGTFSIDYNIR